MNTRRIAAALSIAASLLVVGALPAGATSCVMAPGASPQAIVSGTENLGYDGKFLDHYDGALIGTVTAIRSQSRAQPAGGTKTSVDVIGAIGVDSVPATTFVTSDDEGAMNGYPFEVGTTYFIPFKERGPQGQPNYSFVCDPVGTVDGKAEAEELLATASDKGLVVATITEPLAPTPDTATSGMSLAAAAAVGAVGAALLLAAVVWITRRRRGAGEPSVS